MMEIVKKWNGKEVKVRCSRGVRKSAFEIGLQVEGQAKLLINNITGLLAGSITTKSNNKETLPESPATISDTIKKPQADKEVRVGTNVEYGPHVEFGTIKSNAYPFLRPAFDLAQGKVLTITKRNSRYEFGDYIK